MMQHPWSRFNFHFFPPLSVPLIRSTLWSRGACAHLKCHRASRQDTPWTECQPIAGHTHPSYTTGNLETPISLESCLWTVGGNRSTRRKPTKHRENMQTPHTH
ncbi:hypothetical protein QTP70_023842, partial [Hemibagrus guttatus]